MELVDGDAFQFLNSYAGIIFKITILINAPVEGKRQYEPSEVPVTTKPGALIKWLYSSFCKDYAGSDLWKT